MKIEIRKSTDGQFYWVTKAKNGQIVLTSEMYTRKASVWKAIDSHFASMRFYLVGPHEDNRYDVYFGGTFTIIFSITITDKTKEA